MTSIFPQNKVTKRIRVNTLKQYFLSSDLWSDGLLLDTCTLEVVQPGYVVEMGERNRFRSVGCIEGGYRCYVMWLGIVKAQAMGALCHSGCQCPVSLE